MSANATTVDIEAAAPATRPYGRSWVNALNDWIDRLPGPAWIAYLAAVSLGLGLTFAQALDDLATASPYIIGGGFYYGALPFAVLLLVRNLDRTATEAFRTLRPSLDLDPVEATNLIYRLTVIPARPALIMVVVAVVLGPLSYVLDPVGSGVVGLSTTNLVLRFVWESWVSALFLVLIYHTIRQLRLVDAIHRRIIRIDLFDQGPLYGFSKVTSRTAIGLIVLLVPGVFLIPPEAGVGFIALSVAWYAAAVIIAAAAFVLPLRGIHDRIAAEKRHLQAEIGRRLTVTLEAIHAAVDADDGPAIDARNRALSTLMTERDLVAKVSTWPWSAGALTGFLSAVLLPIGLWIVTRMLERLV